MGSWTRSWTPPSYRAQQFAPTDVTIFCKQRTPQRYHFQLAHEHLESDAAFGRYLSTLQKSHARLNVGDDYEILADVYLAGDIGECVRPLVGSDRARISPHMVTKLIVVDPYELDSNAHAKKRTTGRSTAKTVGGRMAVVEDVTPLPVPECYHLAHVDCGHAHCEEYQARDNDDEEEENYDNDDDDDEEDASAMNEEVVAQPKSAGPRQKERKNGTPVPAAGSYETLITSNQPSAAYDMCMRTLIAAALDDCLPLMELNTQSPDRVIQVSATTCCIKHCTEGATVSGMSRAEYASQCTVRRSGGARKQHTIFLGSARVLCRPGEVVLTCSFRLDADTAELVFVGAQKAFAGCDCLYCRKK